MRLRRILNSAFSLFLALVPVFEYQPVGLCSQFQQVITQAEAVAGS